MFTILYITTPPSLIVIIYKKNLKEGINNNKKWNFAIFHSSNLVEASKMAN